MKTCKYGHPWVEGKKFCSKCGSDRSKAWLKRIDVKAPVYVDLAVKPWRIEA